MTQRGFITESETRALIDQRNHLLIETRKRLSPFGKIYSEILRSSKNLPNYNNLLNKKFTNEAIITSIGKTRSVVNRMTVTIGMVSRGLIAVNLVFAAIVITTAPPEDRDKIAAKEGGTLLGGALGGWGGAWAGCASLAALASPSLVIPIVGEITTGGACVVGGIAGAFGIGALGAWLGGKAGEAAYDYITTIQWRYG